MSHSPSESASTAPVRVAVDVGGTFTDIVLEQEPQRWSAKLLTTPDAPETAVLQGIEELLGQAGLAWPRVDLLILGTTLATNALIERKGARTALLTTAGFRDLVEIGLEDRFAQYDIFLDKPEPLVPRPWRFGVTERVDAHGQVLTPLDEAQVIALAGELTRAGIESVAVCLLHSYAHPGHERRIRALLKQHAPQLWVSLSSDVCAEIREYPRLSTVSANAYVQPQVSGYLRRLNDAARQRGLRDEPFLMTSGGAIATLQTGIDEPVRLVESGPAGGAILAQHIAEQTGAARALSFDMGGTTAKICYIDDFEPQVSRSFEFGRVHRHLKGSGLPIRIPVIEMVEIGAGGGSIARVNHLGVVQVGPDSAGSSPGPAAYGNGGELPTVTDAHALIGTVTPERFAVGKVSLQPERARHAIETHLARPAGLEAPQAAQAIIEVVSENMANAARVHASELGKAAEEHTLIAFGGAAPLHAAGLARKLGIEPRHHPGIGWRGVGRGLPVGADRLPGGAQLPPAPGRHRPCRGAAPAGRADRRGRHRGAARRARSAAEPQAGGLHALQRPGPRDCRGPAGWPLRRRRQRAAGRGLRRTLCPTVRPQPAARGARGRQLVGRRPGRRAPRAAA